MWYDILCFFTLAEHGASRSVCSFLSGGCCPAGLVSVVFVVVLYRIIFMCMSEGLFHPEINENVASC